VKVSVGVREGAERSRVRRDAGNVTTPGRGNSSQPQRTRVPQSLSPPLSLLTFTLHLRSPAASAGERKCGQVTHGTCGAWLPLLPSGPGGVRPSGIAWDLAAKRTVGSGRRHFNLKFNGEAGRTRKETPGTGSRDFARRQKRCGPTGSWCDRGKPRYAATGPTGRIATRMLACHAGPKSGGWLRADPVLDPTAEVTHIGPSSEAGHARFIGSPQVRLQVAYDPVAGFSGGGSFGASAGAGLPSLSLSCG
jgi:hypothetical protein